MIPLEELQLLVGTSLPTGRHTVQPHEHWLACDAIGAPRTASGPAHPITAFHATLVGLGVTLSELFAMFGVADDDGVMAGETTLTQVRPLEIGATYTITAVVRDLERKHGQRLGTFDLMRFEQCVVDPDGETVATIVNSFVFPRR